MESNEMVPLHLKAESSPLSPRWNQANVGALHWVIEYAKL